jgi:hypothetical protein
MLLEDIVLAVLVGVVLLLVGIPIVRLLRVASFRQKDPLAEAQERLRIAQREAEAARVNREAEKIYEHLYDEALAEDHGRVGTRVSSSGSTGASGVAPEEQGDVQAADETAKGKRHGQR